MGIKVSRGKTAADDLSRLQVIPLTTSTGPVHDDASAKKGEFVSVPLLVAELTFHFSTDLVVHAPEAHTPNRTAKGMTLSPSKLYLREVAEPSQVGAVKSPLICFDLDGTVSDISSRPW